MWDFKVKILDKVESTGNYRWEALCSHPNWAVALQALHEFFRRILLKILI